MKVFFGSERCVLAFPRLGFVLKFPSLHRVRWLKNLERTTLQKVRSLICDTIFIATRGIAQNRRERMVSKEIRDSFIATTHFSLLGLVNIQSWHHAVKNKQLDALFFEKMHEVLSSNYDVMPEDAHSWFQVANYSIKSDGSICKVDYGGENDLEVLRHFLPALKQIRVT